MAELVPVIQADRDRLLQSGHPLSREGKEAIQKGEWDHHHLVQAFAQHRLTTRPDTAEIERLRGALSDLADAARSACDARQHQSLIDALMEADFLLSPAALSTIPTIEGMEGE